jgi:hypothetical protein
MCPLRTAGSFFLQKNRELASTVYSSEHALPYISCVFVHIFHASIRKIFLLAHRSIDLSALPVRANLSMMRRVWAVRH